MAYLGRLWESYNHYFTLEHVMELLEQYRGFGPLPGILLPMAEAFLPILPLFIFVIANTNAFGLWLGFLYSWVGACVGALLVFFLVRKFVRGRLANFIGRHEKVKKMMIWIEKHGFGPMFLILCFPFTPSAAVNLVAALSKVSTNQFILAVLAGKMVMIFTMSFIGYDLRALVEQPLRSVIVGVVIFLLWIVGKRIEVRLQTNVKQRDH
ncbi:TVP38/TMEM64 family protein [Bacillus sp. HMF5848]|uniref:TVP38/TMEM64 family protein n=1 Tax=Bacillus sp. HMF5848 TaxID=2495421 RepID=UPI000F7775EB|nr:TVP38/TMEM64 family protein [Bacillus sp. HMF5848]RSK29266.1 TVP38/TMEM64 family protein [Bacillus sp. HMF5848]